MAIIGELQERVYQHIEFTSKGPETVKVTWHDYERLKAEYEDISKRGELGTYYYSLDGTERIRGFEERGVYGYFMGIPIDIIEEAT